MTKIRTARDLYNELLKSFYFGIYRKGDRLMTYKEVHEAYGLAKNTIGAAYAMLREDGFIHTDRTRGTIVTFERDNPAHVAKVPLEWLGENVEDGARYEVTMHLHAHALYTGLIRSNKEQIALYVDITKDILCCIQEKRPFNQRILSLWTHMVSALRNKAIEHITQHFITRYFYLVPIEILPPDERDPLYRSAQSFYEYFLEALENREFTDYLVRFWQYYSDYFQAGGVMFSKLEEDTLFMEQALYGKLLSDLCIKIMAGNLEKGAALPTTAQLCKTYGVSKTTVNRAYRILFDMGVITRQARSGTKLAAHPDDPAIRETLEQAVGIYKQDWKDAIEALLMMNHILNRCRMVSPKAKSEMWMELKRQRNQYDVYCTPFLASAMLIGPLIADLPYGILHKYYFILIDTLNRIKTLYTFRVHGNCAHGEEIYQLIYSALQMLESGNQEQFAIQTERAMRRNTELLEKDFPVGQRNDTSVI